MKETLAELSALRLCDRKKFGTTYRFIINPDWKELILRVEHLDRKDYALEATDFDAEDTAEHQEALEDAFDDGTIFEVPPPSEPDLPLPPQ